MADVAEYLTGQPVIGVDPEPGRNAGVLVTHTPQDAAALPEFETQPDPPARQALKWIVGMDEHERLLLDLVERLNHRLTMDDVHAVADLLAGQADSLRAAVDERSGDPLYVEMMGALYEYARRKIRDATDRAETGGTGRELADIERELLALLRDITNPDREPAAVERLRDHLGEAARAYADVGRTLPERDALKCLYRYADIRSRRAVDLARARAPERIGPDRDTSRYRLDPFAPHGARRDWLLRRGGEGRGCGFSR